MSDPQRREAHGGPVFHGPASGNQFAWNNDQVTQNQRNDGAVAPGFEALARLVGDLLGQLPGAGLAERDRLDAVAAAQEVLAEVTGPEAPEPGRLRRALNGLKGVLAPVATGAAAGVGAATQEWAHEAIRNLTALM
ncbi:hypothetical protein AQI95_23345 [Streptomyces yokosukanensis]|uniref:Uncharacterized protein n=1 Tax=Streptomyces yokosukanensis TaxID=67386 RepID=A0A101P1Y2_9ACTN|nr:hypothetical protein [Streptomyces yokosukanensis]KUN03436.1 hypothetical protein AQI95_23345 [Streptomyces yokosukanensis]